jgi:Tfp pilus assembly protein PilF
MTDKAEKYFRKSFSQEPDNPQRMLVLANFLIETGRNLNEVPELMDKAMTLATNKYDYYNFMNTKGWGLYKQGKYKEALEILEETWNSAPFPLYSIYAHLEELKKGTPNTLVQ